MNNIKNISLFATATILSMSLLTVMAGAAVAPALGAVKEHFSHADPLLVQLIVSMPALFIILTNMCFPALCRHFGTKTLAVAGLTLYVLTGCGVFFLDNIAAILVLRALLGISVGIIMPLSTGLLAFYFPPEKIAGLMGLSAAMNQLGGVVATLLAGMLCVIDWNYAFLVYALGLIALIMVLVWLPQDSFSPKKNDVEEDAQPSGFFPLLRKFHPSVTGMLLLMIIFFIYPTHFAITGHAMRLSQETITWLMVGMDAVAFIAGLLFGNLMKRFPRSMKYWAPLLFIAGMWVLAAAFDINGLIIGCLFIGMATGVGVPYLLTIASIKGGKQASTTVMPLLSAALYLGQFISPILLAPFMSLLGADDSQNAYKIGAVIAFLFLTQTHLTRKFQSLPPRSDADTLRRV